MRPFDEFADMYRRLREKPKPPCGCRVERDLACVEPKGHKGPHVDESGRWWA